MADDKKKDISKMTHKEFLEYQKDLERGGSKAKEKAAQDIMQIHLNTQNEKLVEETRNILRELGVNPDELAREMKIMEEQSSAGKPQDLQKFLDAIKAGNAAKARKYSKKKDVRKAAKNAKNRRGWCPLFLVAILTVGGTIAWGAYEGISAIASSLF